MKKILTLAREEACRLRHDYIGTEHLLLALIRSSSGRALDILRDLEVDLERIRDEVAEVSEPGAESVAADALPFTPNAKTVLELAAQEAQMSRSGVDSEHLLVGLLRARRSRAAILLRAQLSLAAVRARLAD